MAYEFKLPDVGEGLQEAELLRWIVRVGDQVKEDQPIMEVQTDKAAVEISSPVTGKILELRGKEGEILNIGDVVVVIDDGTGAPVAASIPAPEAVKPEQKAEAHGKAEVLGKVEQPAAAPAPAAAAPVKPGGRALATPAVRRVARELGVDINQVPGSGPNGRVTADDVKAFKEGPVAAPAAAASSAAPVVDDAAALAALQEAMQGLAPTGPAVERLPLRGVRRVIAERMIKSKHTAAHVTTVDEADVTELVKMRTVAKEVAAARGVKLSYMPFIIKAIVAALKEFPYLNAQIDDETQEIVVLRTYNIGFAVDTPHGLFVPVVKDADKKSIIQIAAEMQILIEKARTGKLSPDDMRGGTFSISNQGSIGGLFFTPVINHPEVAILGVGATQDRPVVRDGEIVVRKMAYMALSFDHRLIDGGLATRFMNRFVSLLSNPTLLMMEMI